MKEQFAFLKSSIPTNSIEEHPLGDDYLAVIHIISDWKQRAMAAEKELEHLRKHLKESADAKTIKQIKTDVLNSVMSMLDEYVGANCFPYLRAKIRDRLEV